MLSHVSLQAKAQAKPLTRDRLHRWGHVVGALRSAFAGSGQEAGNWSELEADLQGKIPKKLGPGSLLLEAQISDEGLLRILAHSRAQVCSTLLELSQVDQDVPLVVSKAGLAAKIAEQKRCTAVQRDNGDYELFDKRRSLGILSDAQLERLQTKMLGMIVPWESPADDQSPYLDEIARVTGVRISRMEYLWGGVVKTSVERRSDRFELLKRLVLERAKQTSTEHYFDQVDAEFEKTIGNDPIARLAMVVLAGPKGAQVRGGVVLSPQGRKGLKASGESPATGADFWFSLGDAPKNPKITNLAATDGSFMTR
jgi:hypothetical protein